MIRILLNTSIVFFNSQFLFNILGGLVWVPQGQVSDRRCLKSDGRCKMTDA